MITSTSETTRVRTGFAMPHPLAVIEQSRRDGREVVGYRAFYFIEEETKWVIAHPFIQADDTHALNLGEWIGWLLSPVYADEVR